MSKPFKIKDLKEWNEEIKSFDKEMNEKFEKAKLKDYYPLWGLIEFLKKRVFFERATNKLVRSEWNPDTLRFEPAETYKGIGLKFFLTPNSRYWKNPGELIKEMDIMIFCLRGEIERLEKTKKFIEDKQEIVDEFNIIEKL